MGFFSHVQKGDKVKHSTSLENAKRDLVNSFKGIATVQNKARPTSVPVYNASDTTIPSYSAVTLVRGRVLHDVIPVAATSTSLDTIFGITLDAIEPGKIGSAVIEGIATARFTIGYKSHRYAVAGSDGILESADAGPVMLCGIYDEGDTEGLVRLSFEEAESKAVRARIISGSALEGYDAAVIDQLDVIGNNVIIHIHAVELAMNADIPSGTVVIAHSYRMEAKEG